MAYGHSADLSLLGLGAHEEHGGSGRGMLDIALGAQQLGHFGGSAGMTYFPTGIFGNEGCWAGEEVKQMFQIQCSIIAKSMSVK